MTSNETILSDNIVIFKRLADLYRRQSVGDQSVDREVEALEAEFANIFGKDHKRWIAAAMNVGLGNRYDIGFKENNS